MTASLFVSTIVKSIMDCTGLSLEMASPCGDTMVQAALHCASSKGFPFSAACATFAAPIRTVAHVKIARGHLTHGCLLILRSAPHQRSQSLPTCCHNQATGPRQKHPTTHPRLRQTSESGTKGSYQSLRCQKSVSDTLEIDGRPNPPHRRVRDRPLADGSGTPPAGCQMYWKSGCSVQPALSCAV